MAKNNDSIKIAYLKRVRKEAKIMVLRYLLEEVLNPSEVRQAKSAVEYERGFDHGYDVKKYEIKDLINQKIKSLEEK